MQVFTNEKLIESRARMGRIASLSGLVILVIGMVVSFTPQWLLASYFAFICGLFVSTIGIYLANKWIREPRADQALVKGLKGLGDRYRLYNYLLPAEHVLLSPYGLFVLTVKRQEGDIRCQGERWHQGFSWRRIVGGFGGERLGNPTQEHRRDVEAMRQWLSTLLPEAEVPIEGAIVFPDPGANLTIVDPPVPVLVVKKLKSFLRGAAKRGTKMPDELRVKLQGILDAETARG
jgi:hypothetical protein